MFSTIILTMIFAFLTIALIIGEGLISRLIFYKYRHGLISVRNCWTQQAAIILITITTLCILGKL